jgi:hypothetical protein
MNDNITIADVPVKNALHVAINRFAPSQTVRTIADVCAMVGVSSVRVIFVPKGTILNGDVGGFQFYDAHCSKIFWVTDGLGVGMIIPLSKREIETGEITIHAPGSPKNKYGGTS